MPASLLTSPTPLRDLIVATVEDVISDARNRLSAPCAACNRTVEGWCAVCAKCAEHEAVIDELDPILSRLNVTETDQEACKIAGDLFMPGLGRAV